MASVVFLPVVLRFLQDPRTADNKSVPLLWPLRYYRNFLDCFPRRTHKRKGAGLHRTLRQAQSQTNKKPRNRLTPLRRKAAKKAPRNRKAIPLRQGLPTDSSKSFYPNIFISLNNSQKLHQKKSLTALLF